jgi:hypothetical protein
MNTNTNYLIRVLEAAQNARPGTVSVMQIAHEPDCPRPRGGVCTCRDDQINVEVRPL